MLLTEFDEEEYQKAVKRYKARLRKDAEDKIRQEGLQEGKEGLIFNMPSNVVTPEDISKMTGESLKWICSIMNQSK